MTQAARKKRTTKRNTAADKRRKGATRKKAKVAKKATKKKAISKKRATSKTRSKTSASPKTGTVKRATAKRSTSQGKAPSKDVLIHAYHEMVRSRLIDNKIIILYKQNKCHFQIGAAGHEAIQVATAQWFRGGKDWFYPYYRDMALCACIGMTNEDFMLNAMNKDDDPNSHGRQMPMHYGSEDLRIVSQSSPTGTQFLQAVGCAMAIKKLGLDEVVYVSAGEGTCSQGDFHEALNWSAREKLPIVFMIQNNKYAISVPVEDQLAGKSVYLIAQGYENLKRFEVDGTDFTACYKICREAHERAISGKGPCLVEAHVPRLQSHSISDNHLKYRSADDIKDDAGRDPIDRLSKELLKKKILTPKKIKEIETQLKNEVDQAAEWAEVQPDPDPALATTHTFSTMNPGEGIVEATPTGEETYLVDAINHCLDEELEHNPNMYVFGQDVAHGKGGVFAVTAGLTEKHGVERVFNGPLAESSLVGVGIGMATLGLKPVVEVQFGDYIWTAMNQIRNEMAMMRYRSKGDFTCPMVLRVPIGGYIHGACYHSQNIEATFSHFPGLFIVLPSNATDAKGLLKSAIRGNDPVLFLEHKGLYRQVFAKGPEGGVDDLIPLGKAKVVREGTDLTIISYGALVQRSLEAAQALEKEGLEVEVVDLRSIVPLDTETIFESVKKTNKVLMVQEDMTFMGFGAEVIAQISEHCFEHLDGPVSRVGMKYVAAVPHAPVLEDVILPQTADILFEARKVLSY